ncbi:MAG: Y-family DNA polymerase [Phycisphaerae bacterium]
MSLFLCMYLPDWDIQAMRLKQRRTNTLISGMTHGPLLLFLSQRRQEVVGRCCDTCRRRGIFPGMAVAEARALVPQVMMMPLDGMASRRLLEKLARWALRFSPVVSIVEPFPSNQPEPGADCLLLNIGGMEHLDGGPMALARRITGILRRNGLPCRTAIAPTIGSAIALARYAATPARIDNPADISAAMGEFPAAALRISADTQAALREVGITRVGQVMSIARDQLAVRFPPELLLRLDQILGRRMELPAMITLSTAPEAQWRADGPVENLEGILLAARALTQRLAHELTQRNLGTTLLTVNVAGADIGTSTIAIALAQAVRRADRLWAAIRPRMEQLRLSGGIEVLTFRAMETHLLPPEQLHANTCARWQYHDAMTPLAPVLDILRTRLPAARIGTVAAGRSHIPEQAMRLTMLETAGGRLIRPDDFITTQRPSLLLAPPESVQVITDETENAPGHIQWRGNIYTCRQVIGPERLTTAWWTGAAAVTRDYFSVLDQQGQWLWVFHEVETGQWLLHGLWV